MRAFTSVRLQYVATILVLLTSAVLSGCEQDGTAARTPVPTLPTLPPFATQTTPPQPTPTAFVVHAQPASTQGWAIYRDSRFPFQMPIPPGWRYGSFIDNRNGQTQCEEVVAFMPPGSSGAIIDGFEEKAPEYIALFVQINCPAYHPTVNPPSNILETPQATVGGTPVNWYGMDDPVYGSSRVAAATFGDRSYQFLLQAPPANSRADIALFLGMMQGFKYTGN